MAYCSLGPAIKHTSSIVIISVCGLCQIHCAFCGERPGPELGLENRHLQRRISFVRFEVFKAVTMKNGVFWDIRSCGSCNTTWHFFAACVGC
jgi:hypothetical protein